MSKKRLALVRRAPVQTLQVLLEVQAANVEAARALANPQKVRRLVTNYHLSLCPN